MSPRAIRVFALIGGLFSTIILYQAPQANAAPAKAATKKAAEFPREWFWGEDEQRAQQDMLVGKPAPKLTLSNWIGPEVKSDELKGKVVVVDLWATWCGPCLASIPHNNEMYEKYHDKGLVIIGVCGSEDGQEKMPAVAREKGIKYPLARDATQATAKAWRLMWWPTYGVVDRKGNLRALGLQPNHVEAVVEKLLAEKAPDKEYKDAGAGQEPKESKPKSEGGAVATVRKEWLEGNVERRKSLAALENAAPPKLTVKEWTNSNLLALDELKGKVVVLDFWTTSCGPCIANIPHSNELAAKYNDRGLVFIGVCTNKDIDKMAEIVKDKGIKYPVAADLDDATAKAYLVDGFPDYYIIDRAGRLRIADCANNSIDDAIKALLDEAAPE